MSFIRTTEKTTRIKTEYYHDNWDNIIREDTEVEEEISVMTVYCGKCGSWALTYLNPTNYTNGGLIELLNSLGCFLLLVTLGVPILLLSIIGVVILITHSYLLGIPALLLLIFLIYKFFDVDKRHKFSCKNCGYTFEHKTNNSLDNPFNYNEGSFEQLRKQIYPTTVLRQNIDGDERIRMFIRY